MKTEDLSRDHVNMAYFLTNEENQSIVKQIGQLEVAIQTLRDRQKFINKRASSLLMEIEARDERERTKNKTPLDPMASLWPPEIEEFCKELEAKNVTNKKSD